MAAASSFGKNAASKCSVWTRYHGPSQWPGCPAFTDRGRTARWSSTAQHSSARAIFDRGRVDLPVRPLPPVPHGVVSGVPAEAEHSAAADIDDSGQQGMGPSRPDKAMEVRMGVDGDHQAVAGAVPGPRPKLFGDISGFVEGEVEPAERPVPA